MRLIKEFREFALKGNVVDLAVGVVIGGAFQKIVDSLVKDIVMPVVGQLIGGVDFAYLYINLSHQSYPTMEAAERAGAPLLKYGRFLNTMIDFLIVAAAIFVAVKVINSLRRQQPPAPPAQPAPEPVEVGLLREIRDSLQRLPAPDGRVGAPEELRKQS